MRRGNEVRRSKLLGAVLPILITLQVGAAAGYAAPPSALPPGMGKYIMVLWPAGSPIPAGGPPVSVKKVPEPDVAKMGGQVLAKADNLRLILLPLAAAAELRRHEAVVYLQRVWTGESLAGWNEAYQAPPGPRLQRAPQDDTNLQWGPKAYGYDGSGNIKSIGPDQFTYDSAGRLIQAVVGGTTESYKYDAFGNLIEKAVAGTNPVTVPVDGESNRIEGVPYDAAGNATTAEDGRRKYKYDSLNMVTRVQSSTNNQQLIYDADDERIGTVNLPPDTLSRWTIRDFEGRILREYKGSGLGVGTGMGAWTWESDYFYGESSLMGGETEEWGYTADYRYGGRRHYHLDHLGSVRMVTTEESGTSRPRSISEHDYYPFGRTQTHTFQEQINWGDPHMDAMRFAGHWRDFLGGINADNAEYLDYMHARYYDPNLGRFLSVDSHRGHPERPQSWNRYAYTQNNPLKAIDPDGKETQLIVGNQTNSNLFGHLAIAINGRVYSYGTQYTSKTGSKDWGASETKYLDAQKNLRSSEVITLKVSPQQEQKLQQDLESHNPNAPDAPKYGVASNSCVTVIDNALIRSGTIPAPQSPLTGEFTPPGTTPSVLPEGVVQNVGNAGLIGDGQTVGKDAQPGAWSILVDTVLSSIPPIY